MSKIPEHLVDLLEKPIVATLTTIAADGIPENTAIWTDWDGEHVLVNTADGRRKPENIRNNPNVALFVLDPENPYRWIDVRGVVEEMVPDEDYTYINSVAKLYAGVDEYYGGVAPIEQKGKEDRLLIKIKPVRVASQG